MSGGSCAVIIVTNEATAASATMNGFADQGLLTDEQQREVLKCSQRYIEELNKVAEEIPDPE